MFLTNEEIAAIAQWQPICPGFGRDDTQTSARVLAIKDRINASGEFGCELVFDDGLANYFTLFSYLVADVPSYALARSVEGLLIYLSACGPVSVAGRSRKCVGEGILTHDPLRYDALMAPDHPGTRLEATILEAIRSGGYELLTPQEALSPLPSGVVPWEYHHAPGPCDRVFHALFANTD